MAAASSMPDRQQRLVQLIECPICLNELEDPRLTSCRHIYCYECLKDYQKKGNHGNSLPCPQCRQVTSLYEGGVDNLPKFFFMNELKEVVMTEEREDNDDVHSKSRYSQSHQVIIASEGEALIKSNVPLFPPCHRHTHQLVDLYCLKCDQPMCNTCSNSIHDGHKRCELVEKADLCKAKLKEINEDTDGMIKVVKQAINETKNQLKQAEEDLDYAHANIKSTFQLINDEKEKTMLSALEQAHRRMKKTSDATLDSQMMTLAGLESLKSCEIKLAERDRAYDYVTATTSMQRDVDHHLSRELPGMMWSCQIVPENKSSKLNNKKRVELSHSVVTRNVEVIGSAGSDKQVEVREVGRIRVHSKGRGEVRSVVVHQQRVYVVHDTGLIVYCYKLDGSLSHQYEHEGGAGATVSGMCLVMVGDTVKLVIGDCTGKTLIWIEIRDVTMVYHHLLKLHYVPGGIYNDRGDVCVSDGHNSKIHRYRRDGKKMLVTKLPDSIIPQWMARHGDGDQFVISDYTNQQIIIIDPGKHTKTVYKGAIHGVKLGIPSDVITDPLRGVLITDYRLNQVLLLRRTGQVKKILDQHVRSPRSMHADSDHHRLYVSGKDQHDKNHVFVFTSRLLSGNKKLTMKITKINIKVKI